MSDPRVFTIAASTPFLPALADALLSGALVPGFAPRNDPLALAGATVFLPTRRAARAFADALLDALGLGREAALLPRIVPLGEVDEDVFAFDEASRDIALAPAPTPGERRLVLARLVLQFARATAKSGEPLVAATPAAALSLADELARLFDDLTIADVSFSRLDDGLVPAALDEYWQRSLQFLKLAEPAWRAFLAESGRLDPAVRRDRLLALEAKRLTESGGGPYVIAGSTGTIPAVAGLIAAIASRPDGAVVLPGLDQILDEQSFGLIGGGTLDGADIEPSPGHPQFGLKRLLARLGIQRSQVTPLGAAPAERDRLLSEAFRPAATTGSWRQRGDILSEDAAAAALAKLILVEAADPREEALVLALELRAALESADMQAALVTPDRALARRVSAELRRWNIEADDSAGLALADTEAGRFATLAAAAAAEQLAPVPLLAVLRHPLAKLGANPMAVDRLELGVLRGPRPSPGAEGLQRAIAEARAQDLHRRDLRANWRDADWRLAEDLARGIGAAFGPLLALADEEAVPLAVLLQAHRETLTALGLDLDGERPDIGALARAFEEFEGAGSEFMLRLSDYADAFTHLLAGEAPVRPPFDPHARIRILGPLEARLLRFDRVLLGGLNEGTWPPETHADAWLNRPMRKQLGLDLPERRIGLTAHDFAQAMGAEEIVLTRAKKQNGVETVASRFLQRLAAIAPETEWKAARERGERLLDVVREWEKPAQVQHAPRPAPAPPVAARPARFSVTDIETLVRDPYSIYARDVLRLAPLDPLDADPGAAERGTILHEALAEFLKAFPEQLPADAENHLLECGGRAFAAIADFPGIKAIWWPRFQRVARWFLDQERERRNDIVRSLAETHGAIELQCGERTFRLTARADRIDLRKDGTVAVLDYKTGQPPGINEVLIGLAPQLPLEAAIVRGGGFAQVPAQARIAEIAVVRLSGGTPPGDIRVLDPAKATGKARERAAQLDITDFNRLADASRDRLQALLAAFDNAETPYHSIPRPKWRGRFGRYDHLARIKEWSAGGDGGEE